MYTKEGVSCCLKIFWVCFVMWALCEQGGLLEGVLEEELTLGGERTIQYVNDVL